MKYDIKKAKSGIHIKPENKGKFTETKKRTGKSTEELTHSKNPLTRKRAIFAQNAKKWKHQQGGKLEEQKKLKIEYDNLKKFYLEAREAIGKNDTEKLKTLGNFAKPYSSNDLTRDYNTLQSIRKKLDFSPIENFLEEFSLTIPHAGQQIRGTVNEITGLHLKEGGKINYDISKILDLWKK